MISIQELTKLNGQHLLLFGAVALLPIPALGAIIEYFPSALVMLDVFKITIVIVVSGVVSISPAMSVFFMKHRTGGNSEIPYHRFAKYSFIQLCNVLGMLALLLLALCFLFRVPFELYLISQLILIFIVVPYIANRYK